MGTGRGLLAIGASIAVSGCGPLSVTEERHLGDQFEYQMRSELPLLHDRVISRYVSEMGEGLIRASGPQPFRYRFYVVRDEEINAFAGPAGHVYVHTETILRARDASELAGVLAHEVAHVQQRHIAANYNRARNARIGTDILALGAGVFGGGVAGSATALGGGLAANTWLNSFSREAELEADEFSVGTMVRAGWDPNGLVSFFESLAQEEDSSVPAFLSSHPATQERIEAARAEIQRLDGTRGLASDDGGKLEIIQRRIRLLTGSHR
ncbi:MAG: M48 family metallopeptidase [Myxococcota bacterium]|jgi:predicted Zn-dependent protease|nr:peptidase M48 Ste24p [Deltaproteobacteria bacterium]MCP4241472.1 M48 family metalloprotease [bacterium]MDP6074044.1 M48 family metallopeptidase [Myxococcota bacterium]MDP7073435.1 M48 family metallopeptidase [Myxococcota bacterium]MDP7300052.1 M48 family metallopeptidase [Myxococcota bacterium]